MGITSPRSPGPSYTAGSDPLLPFLPRSLRGPDGGGKFYWSHVSPAVTSASRPRARPPGSTALCPQSHREPRKALGASVGTRGRPPERPASSFLRRWLSTQDDFAPHARGGVWQGLETSLVSQPGVRESQGCSSTSRHTQNGPTAKTRLAPSATSAEAEKPCPATASLEETVGSGQILNARTSD